MLSALRVLTQKISDANVKMERAFYKIHYFEIWMISAPGIKLP